MTAPRILFICKNRSVPYTGDSDNDLVKGVGKLSSGLLNSVTFVVDMLINMGVNAKLVDVVDNNAIDKEVSLYKPTHVVIEALWVIPSKFDILVKLHPTVKWIVRLHSDTPFIAGEGIALDWIFLSDKHENVSLAVNSDKMLEDLNGLLKKPLYYLPNYYPIDEQKPLFKIHSIRKEDGVIDIGCFGAIRLLKNQLIQAVAAIKFADKIGKKLRFHINGNRVEGNADPVLKNIKNLFLNNDKGHTLVEHNWMPHEQFIKIIAGMDIAMQVSFSETYNIVTADAIAQGVPVVTSEEIDFVTCLFKAKTTCTRDIVRTLHRTYILSKFNLHYFNEVKLWKNSQTSVKAWKRAFDI